MAISTHISDRELNKFIEKPNTGDVAVRVFIANDSGDPIPTSGSSGSSSDIISTSGIETTLSITTTASVAKVGASNLADRKYIFIEAQEAGVKWGFSSSCLFNAFKNQAIWIPAGDAVDVYLKTSSGTIDVVVAEGT